jgi:hypothetical protein
MRILLALQNDTGENIEQAQDDLDPFSWSQRT